MLKFNANRMSMSDRIKTLRDYTNHYHKSVVSPEKFWGEIAENFDWRKKWNQVLSWDFETPKISWFENAKLNLTENIFERLLSTHENKTAIIWEPNDPRKNPIHLTYGELFKATVNLPMQ